LNSDLNRPLAQNLNRLATALPGKRGVLAGVLQFYSEQD
jgi:hypothetical protein